ncbi:putative integral membrane protein [Motilibacter peucedani]|uniref:Putative integral membrane protein n=1 Tax=Motilibacter peucedani TaxID=598650 RepID=A0A420XV06_9ACTN|nr:lipopolysaccharide assembly protein LapA domain-containing protein [Motilibacter peucedani]RKS80683.1 putative integral membrane protein [Motilibacter peucedani]
MSNPEQLPPPHRTGRAWAALVPAGLVLVVVLVFVLQNLKRTKVRFLWLDGSFPLGVALLLSAVLGGLLVALVASVRLLQVRRTARRGRR